MNQTNPRRIIPWTLFWSLALSVTSAAAQHEWRPSKYFPLDVGNTWHYRAGKTKITYRVTKHETVNGVTCARLESPGNKKTHVEFVTSQKDGIYRYKAKETVLTKPLCLLKLPAKKGQTWKWDSKLGDLDIQGECKTGAEEITVPAGKFQTISVSCAELQFGLRYLSIKSWYAPNVGLVKQRLVIAGHELTLELEKFEKGP